MRLLERDEPLAALHRLRGEAASGAGRLVFVEGEAGVGKTSLLRAFRANVEPGVRVLFGSCDPLSTPRPLGPIVDVAEELDPAFRQLLEDGASRDAVLQGLLRALRATGGDLVLLLDDLHWADEATLDALRFVGRRLDGTRALVIATYRDDEVGRLHPLRAVVGELATSPAVRRVRLSPLSEAAVGELARGTTLDPLELHHRTGGNPFYVTEVIAGAPARIPATVRDAVLARAARLTPAGRGTLEAAAVIGPVVEAGLIAEVVDDLDAEDCLAKGLLQADGRHYAFRHELARQAVLEATDPGRRATLNARVLAALEDRPETEQEPALLAHHADEAGNAEAVLRHARHAARLAEAAGAHRQAAAQLARCLPYAAALPDEERAHLLLAAGLEHTTIGQIERAVELFRGAAGLWHRLGDRGQEVRALANLTRSYLSTARNAEAAQTAALALELVEPLPDGPEKVDAIGILAYLRMLDRDNLEAIELGREAIRIGAEDPQAAIAVAMTWNTVGAARILSGDLGGVDDLETSLRLALAQGFDRQAASAYAVCASALGEVYRFSDADRWFEDGLRYTTERDLDANRLYLESWLALSELHRGHWSQAGTLAAGVIDSPASATIAGIMALLALGRLRARRGDPDAWTALDEALALADPTGTLQRVGPVRAARAEAAWLDGDLERCGEEARAAFELARAKAHPWHIGELAWWQAKAGIEPPPDTTGAAEPWRVQLEGRWRAASDAWLALECPYEAARALLESPDPADLREALATFEQLGAQPAIAIAIRRLRAAGERSIPRGPRPSTRANPLGLTSRELEVLRHVAAGLQNHEIAGRLFLSPRTVDHHVSAVLGKLGVERRGDVGAAAAAAGIDLQTGQSPAPD
jgi:DNA-binding CsgD family transcriptional regulator/tetratricopeptide (TPR) repeat protein